MKLPYYLLLLALLMVGCESDPEFKIVLYAYSNEYCIKDGERFLERNIQTGELYIGNWGIISDVLPSWRVRCESKECCEKAINEYFEQKSGRIIREKIVTP